MDIHEKYRIVCEGGQVWKYRRNTGEDVKEVGCVNRGDTSGGNGAINTVVEAATLHHFPPLCCTDKCAVFSKNVHCAVYVQCSV